ncbi:hypothetical protein U9M48_025799 [Paspalum notatum var. saurae]|uniref:glutaminase n=1 Tax=Paspalum notatum var. saurae TaxID=547442 RepID=A0AAQ3TRH1_PASNO
MWRRHVHRNGVVWPPPPRRRAASSSPPHPSHSAPRDVTAHNHFLHQPASLRPTEEAERGAMAVVGVLALQGSYNEHMAALRRIGVRGVEVRKPEQLLGVDSLIIPGGESTTMAKLANYHNLIASPDGDHYMFPEFPALREFVSGGKPVWGTCAGLIFLANKAIGQKTGGQELVGGLDCTVHRNFFGSQLQSFETELSVPKLAEKEGGNDTCRGVFIRAPAILEVGSDVEILADCPIPADGPKVIISSGEDAEEQVYSKDRVIVAVRQGNILATAFHPELTSDSRWHRFFLDMDKESPAKAFSALSLSSSSREAEDLPKNRPLDLPIFE